MVNSKKLFALRPEPGDGSRRKGDPTLDLPTLSRQ